MLTDGSGTGDCSFPFNPAHFGIRLYQQAIRHDPTLNRIGHSVSNDSSYVLGDRPF